MIAENVKNIRQRLASACLRVGRKPEEITLIAVAKTFAAGNVQEVVEAGVSDIGENYVQELQKKQEALLAQNIRWHFIGHLQTNKVKLIAPWIHCIHTVDSIRLGKSISAAAESAGRTVDILVEVNTSGEMSKFGVSAEEATGLVKDLALLPNLRTRGLMTIGPFLPDPEASRPAFRVLKEVRDSLAHEGLQLPFLSMGMTNDFEVAISEGATHIRIGTAIFGKRSKPVE